MGPGDDSTPATASGSGAAGTAPANPNGRAADLQELYARTDALGLALANSTSIAERTVAQLQLAQGELQATKETLRQSEEENRNLKARMAKHEAKQEIMQTFDIGAFSDGAVRKNAEHTQRIMTELEKIDTDTKLITTTDDLGYARELAEGILKHAEVTRRYLCARWGMLVVADTEGWVAAQEHYARLQKNSIADLSVPTQSLAVPTQAQIDRAVQACDRRQKSAGKDSAGPSKASTNSVKTEVRENPVVNSGKRPFNNGPNFYNGYGHNGEHKHYRRQY